MNIVSFDFSPLNSDTIYPRKMNFPKHFPIVSLLRGPELRLTMFIRTFQNGQLPWWTTLTDIEIDWLDSEVQYVKETEIKEKTMFIT